MATTFKDVTEILSDERAPGGALAGQGNDHFASDFDEPATVIQTGEDLMWEIRHKDSEEIQYAKDLVQFVQGIKGMPVMQEGIDKLMSPQGYGVPEGKSFDIEPSDGVGDVSKYEARLVNRARSVAPKPVPANDNVDGKVNYVEPTGQ